MGEDLTGLTQMKDGVCRTHGMKLKIQVRRGGTKLTPRGYPLFSLSRLIRKLDNLDFKRYFLDADGIRRIISDDEPEDDKIRFPEYFGKF